MVLVAIRVEALEPSALLEERRQELERLWREVWPATSDELYSMLPRHSRREGFLFLAAWDGRRIVGFAYGYVGGDGERWHERIAQAMTEAQRERWLVPLELEVIELGVHPDLRRVGIGGRLHDELLARAARPTAVLATDTDNQAAISFYEARGWETIIPEVRIGRPYRVMGNEQPAHAMR